MSIFLDEIIGNDKVKTILSNILQSGNIPHAFLFTGIDGVGKENAAISFTKELNRLKENLEKSNHYLHKLIIFLNHILNIFYRCQEVKVKPIRMIRTKNLQMMRLIK